ncbi:Crp/Fnr family transcriptional regulator [Aquicoccus porphyridii]|uniref:Crp/Fnr family transcriptional regulator n=2 Tax=Aquicoccus porphyridii TaxID=1852029 RepID=A0A5A9ZT33_9RHOB|nr:Crp/Fnr family transcriptional regulator [Aquicoccus porphyridii]RAI55059.1 Crp/Fnr family transcriptional regulator [Rhodobacteraceae bacterium AsT-22]
MRHVVGLAMGGVVLRGGQSGQGEDEQDRYCVFHVALVLWVSRLLQADPAQHMIAIMQHVLESAFAGSRSVELTAGTVLFRTGAPVTDIYLVRVGRVHLCRHSIHGAVMVLQNATAGAVLAEASAYSGAYHCDAVAMDRSVLSRVPKARFLRALAEEPELAAQWAATLARGVQAARLRAEIRSLPRVADRLDAWLDAGMSLPGKGHWQDVAAELGVSREALYRELARRRKGGKET